ncbi:DoxX family protein [Flavobacteriaceae bacterium F08102]|nr:DoxX family protein [Flavobacteriaceae bacterium F08102]
MKNKQIAFTLLFLRVGFSMMMLTHGIPKLGLINAAPLKFPDPLGVGMFISLLLALIGEVVCPILIIVGYKVRWTVIPVIITMLVALFLIHWEDDFATKEKAILYAIAFIAIGLSGGGKYAIRK